ncbi:hypothetical protein NDU88_011118 [Pleurodeles waltl]|uniref:Uncharacterized protein n=1 Tax=Pleurodeles waltl TaxID=8319 RepID=A0AAV7QWB6_PLEWA|nr:hypothetical protein NDU88_011118 [Pleurodeles waltl]
MGMPLAKEEDPTTCLSFPGIKLDTLDGVCRFPQAKVRELKQVIEDFKTRKKATLGELQQLIRWLNFAGRVIPAGRPFARRLAWLCRDLREKHHRVRITQGVKEDLRQWLSFLTNFNRTIIWRDPSVTAQQLELFTDTAGEEGFGQPEQWQDQGLVGRTLIQWAAARKEYGGVWFKNTEVTWLGKPDMRCAHLINDLEWALQRKGNPDAVVVHLRGNDLAELGRKRTLVSVSVSLDGIIVDAAPC